MKYTLAFHAEGKKLEEICDVISRFLATQCLLFEVVYEANPLRKHKL